MIAMRPAFGLLVRLWLAALLSILVMMPANVYADALENIDNTRRIDHATVTTRVQGSVVEKDIILPYAWDKENRSSSGTAVFLSYFSASEKLDQPWAIYLEKVGNAYEVWLNDVLLQRQGKIVSFNRGDYSQLPRIIIIPAKMIKPVNQLRIIIRADEGRKAGLSSILAGPQEEILPFYERSHFIKATGSLLVCMFSLLTGSFALVLWLTQPEYAPDTGLRRSNLYFYAAVAELVWTFGVGYMFLEIPPLAWPWWGVLANFAGVIWRAAMILFCLEVAGWQKRRSAIRLRRWLFFLVAITPLLVTLALVQNWPWLMTVTYLIEGLTFIVFGVWFFIGMLRQSSLPAKLLAGALLFNVAVGLRDIYVLRIDIDYVNFTWLRFSSVLFGATLSIIVLARFRLLSSQTRDLADTLTIRVRQKEQELTLAWAHSELLVRQQERDIERRNILRDMHDGVGSHISSAIRQLESGKSNTSDVLLTLRDSLDQLKLSIDSMNQPVGDLNSLLANLRYRLEPRLKSTGIEMQWNVEQIPVVERLDANAMRQLQFLFFEIFSNIMQHAGASVVTLHAGLINNNFSADKEITPHIFMRVEDNGKGFDVRGTQQRGLLLMQQRAIALGCQLIVTSQPGLTAIEVQFPL